MSTHHDPLNRADSTALLEWIDAIADRFEAAWRQGPPPRIADFLGTVPAAGRADLLEELVTIDLEYRFRHADPRPLEAYLDEFPELRGPDGRLSDRLVGRVRKVREKFAADDLSEALEPASVSSPALDTHRQDGTPDAGQAGLPLLPTLQGYEIREELGRGGMGIVLTCRDNPLGRDLAIKVLREELRDKPAAARRFLEEAQITGQLQHPGVVPVHQIGRLPDGRPYFTMKLVRGQTLASLLHARAAPAQDQPRFLGVFQQVCQTLAFAHQRRVVHRDLKPANIMVGAFDEVQVMDWGLAKVLDGSASASASPAHEDAIRTLRSDAPDSASRTGTVLGTPAYMAPEQARGESARLDERCDVFGLGAILCEILTGKPPYWGATIEQVCWQARQGELSEARQRLQTCGADGELIRLAQRCLAADPSERPVHAGEVAHAISAYLASVQDRLRQAEADRAAAQARAQAERRARRWTLVAAAAALAVLLLGGGGWLWWHERARAVGEHVESLLQQMDRLMREEQWPEALAVAQQADALLATGGLPTALRQRVREQLADATMVVELEDRLLNVKRVHGHYASGAGARPYAEMFRNYGIDVEALAPAEAAERIRGRAIGDYLTAALERWARLSAASEIRERLVAIAEAATPEDRRAELRAARETRDRTALQRLADAIDVRQRSPQTLLQLSFALEREEDSTAALSLLRRAQQHYPGDFGITNQLVDLLYRDKSHPWDEMLRLQTARLALRSRNPAMHTTLGDLLEKKGRLEEAIAAYREGIRLEPEFDPAYTDLGLALEKKGQLDEATAALQEACRLKPDRADYRVQLGKVLVKRERIDEAIAALQEAVRLDPKWAEAHLQLGLALARQQRSDEAEKAFKEAVRVNPDKAAAHVRLGQVFHEQGRPDDAVVAFREALRLQPNNAWAHGFLGIVLENSGHLDEGIASYRESLRHDADSPEMHLILGVALRKKGAFAESLAECRRGHELTLKNQPPPSPSAQQVREAERLVELDGKLPAILRDAIRPADAAERLELANLCTFKNLPAAAARFFGEAFTAQPALAEDLKTGHRYNAACAAALAGCGQGQDTALLDDQARARWREQALVWLRADLALWTRQLANATPDERAAARQMLAHWQRDPDLAGLRERDALTRLPEAERQACRQLWTRVRELREQPTRGKDR
jgi:serine/threonine-protein kinase